jgi:hypothetical protein
MVKVQIPGNTGAITLRPATAAVALAPKPSPTAGTNPTSTSQTLTAIKVGSVASPAPSQQVIMKGNL